MPASQHPPSFEALTEALPVGLGLFDRELRFTRINAQLALWNRLDAQQVAGRGIFEVLPPPEAQRLSVRLREVFGAGAQLGPVEVAALTPETGQSRHGLATYFPLRDDGGAITHVGAVIVDVTAQKVAELERKQLLAREQQAREELSRTVRYHELFAGMLGHDLRNPLGSIMAGAELLLRRGAEDGRISDPAGRIFRSAERMSRMVDQLLDYARTRVGGGLSLDRGEVDLAERAKKVVLEHEGGHTRGGFQLTIAGDVRGWWDKARVEQLLANLGSNAAHHGDEGPRRVCVDGRDDKKVVFSVHNPGVIDAELLGALFDPLRARQGAKRRSRGLGLGLYLSQQIAQAHESLLEVSSTAGEGTRFTLALPRSAGAVRQAVS